jgi:hypothetical protein
VLDERLPAPAGVDGHAQRHVDRAAELGQRGDGGAGVDRDAGARAELAHHLHRICDVRRGLGVHRHRVGSGLHEVSDVALGPVDHQMHVEHRANLARLPRDPVENQRADRDRRHEVAIHHVHVDHARPRGEHLADLLAQAPEVRRQDRGRDAHAVQQLAGQLAHGAALMQRAPYERAGQAGQGRRERGVLCTRAGTDREAVGEDADPAPACALIWAAASSRRSDCT